MKLLKYIIFILPVLTFASTVPVVESPYNDMKPYVASYSMNSPDFTMAWERGDTTVSCTIYVAIDNSDFTNITPLKLTDGNYIDKNPVVTYVDSLHPMIIWERKNGSYFQLYSSYYQGNGLWSNPEEIFSILDDEVFPFAYGNRLYFESLGRIYYAYFNGISWSSASIVSDLGYDGNCHHPTYSTSENLVYEVYTSSLWRVYHYDSLFSGSSSSAMYPMVTNYGNYLITKKNGSIYSLILYDGTTEHVLDTSNLFLGHQRIVDVGAITKENVGDFESYVKDGSFRTVYASNWVNSQKYILNSGNYNGDYPSMCVINGYRTLYKIPVVFQELHNGKWDIYGDIFTLSNGGVEENRSNNNITDIDVYYQKNAIKIQMKTEGTIYGIDGTPVTKLRRGVSKISLHSIPKGVYFIKSLSGETKKINIQ